MRDWHRRVPIPQCFRLCLLVGTLSGEQDQWWQGALYQESPRQEPRCYCATNGGQLAASCKRLSRRVLSAHHSETRQAPGNHRHRSQTRTHCVSPAWHEGSLRRECLSPLRRRSSKTRAISAPKASSSARVSSHPPTERVMFLGSRLVF